MTTTRKNRRSRRTPASLFTTNTIADKVLVLALVTALIGFAYISVFMPLMHGIGGFIMDINEKYRDTGRFLILSSAKWTYLSYLGFSAFLVVKLLSMVDRKDKKSVAELVLILGAVFVACIGLPKLLPQSTGTCSAILGFITASLPILSIMPIRPDAAEPTKDSRIVIMPYVPDDEYDGNRSFYDFDAEEAKAKADSKRDSNEDTDRSDSKDNSDAEADATTEN